MYEKLRKLLPHDVTDSFSKVCVLQNKTGLGRFAGDIQLTTRLYILRKYNTHGKNEQNDNIIVCAFLSHDFVVNSF